MNKNDRAVFQHIHELMREVALWYPKSEPYPWPVGKQYHELEREKYESYIKFMDDYTHCLSLVMETFATGNHHLDLWMQRLESLVIGHRGKFNKIDPDKLYEAPAATAE